jgi:hypothetical protein
MPFLHATAMTPIRQNGRTNQNITASMPTIRQNGRTYAILARGHHATHTPNWASNQNITSSMPPIHQNGCTCNILAQDRHATHTSKWADLSEHYYCHPHTPKYGLIPFLHSITTPPICKIDESRPPYLHATHTLKCMTTSCSRSPCHTYAKMCGPIRPSLPPCHQYGKMDGRVVFLPATAMSPIRQN